VRGKGFFLVLKEFEGTVVTMWGSGTIAREVLRLAPSHRSVSLNQKSFDLRVDLFMTGRIGMDAVQ